MARNNNTGLKQEVIDAISKRQGKAPPNVTATTGFERNGPESTDEGFGIHVYLHGFSDDGNSGKDKSPLDKNLRDDKADWG